MGQSVRDKVVEAILNVRKVQPGAILISGAWGIGKTYFWKNSIVPELKRFNRDHLYVSLGSVETPSDFYKKLAFSYVALRFTKMNTGGCFSRCKELVLFLGRLFKTTLFNLPFKLNLGDVSLSYEGAVKLTWGLLDYKEALPTDCIICVDDFERSQLKEQDLLTLCLGLQEIKQATIVLICNEERFDEGIFKVNKEKLVWKTYTFLPEVNSAFDHFLADYSLKEHHEKLVTFKEDILEPFNLSGKNLRILARCIKGLGDILKVGGDMVTAEHIKFYCSLYSWSQVKGELIEIEAYRPETAYSLGRNILKEEAGEQVEFTQVERESTVFHKQFYTSSLHNGFSEAIYYLVRDGVLNDEAFLKEITPASITPSVKLLRELGEEHWYYWSDEKYNKCIDLIVNLIETDKNSRFTVYLGLAIRALEFCGQIDRQFPEAINEALEKKIIERAPFDDDADSIIFSHENQSLKAYALPWLDKYRAEVTSAKAKKIVTNLLNEIKQGETINTKVIMRDHNNQEALKLVLKSKELLDLIHSMRDSHQEVYYLFFTRALGSLQGFPGSNVHEVAELYKDMVESWKPMDVSSSKRKASLLSFIEGVIGTRN